MARSSFLDTLGNQLIALPPTSAQVMDRVAAGSPPPALALDIDGAALAGAALGAAGDMLRDEWDWDRMSPTPIAVPFQAESGRFDVVRFGYSRGPVQVAVAQATDVIALRFRGLDVDRTFPLELQAEATAKLLFRSVAKRPPFAFGPAWPTKDGFYSERIAPHTSMPSWNDVLTFWSDGVDIGFITLKSDGAMRQSAPSVDEQTNAHWFGRFTNRRSPGTKR